MATLSGLVGLVGDVHAEDAQLARVLDYFEASRVSAVLCVGDIADGPGSVNRCCRLLRQSGAATVRGNHDRWALDGKLRDLPMATSMEAVSQTTREFIAALPGTLDFDTPLGSLLLGHGLGEDDMAQIMPFDEDYPDSAKCSLDALRATGHALYVGGHTHIPGLLRFNDLTVINAGTLRQDQRPCCSLLDFDEGKWRLLSLGQRIAQTHVEELLGAPSESVRRYERLG